MSLAPDREVWLVRHAESAWNALGRWQGQGDPILSARGRAQARALGEALRDASLEELWTSDLRRAQETAAAVAEVLGLPLQIDERLRERDLGCWSGLSTPQIAGRWPEGLARLRAGDTDFAPDGGESLADVRLRATAFLRMLASSGGRVALVSHGGWIRALVPQHRAKNAEALPTSLATLLGGLEGSITLDLQERL